mmetsp:Transcript_86791/g.221116  ORF Transcript_86791/g.221116 Transcript_86791/m.221116 type:complete len:438 (-) Transcript_86791:273-1586(-)
MLTLLQVVAREELSPRRSRLAVLQVEACREVRGEVRHDAEAAAAQALPRRQWRSTQGHRELNVPSGVARALPHELRWQAHHLLALRRPAAGILDLHRKALQEAERIHGAAGEAETGGAAAEEVGPSDLQKCIASRDVQARPADWLEVPSPLRVQQPLCLVLAPEQLLGNGPAPFPRVVQSAPAAHVFAALELGVGGEEALGECVVAFHGREVEGRAALRCLRVCTGAGLEEHLCHSQVPARACRVQRRQPSRRPQLQCHLQAPPLRRGCGEQRAAALGEAAGGRDVQRRLPGVIQVHHLRPVPEQQPQGVAEPALRRPKQRCLPRGIDGKVQATTARQDGRASFQATTTCGEVQDGGQRAHAWEAVPGKVGCPRELHCLTSSCGIRLTEALWTRRLELVEPLQQVVEPGQIRLALPGPDLTQRPRRQRRGWQCRWRR